MDHYKHMDWDQNGRGKVGEGTERHETDVKRTAEGGFKIKQK